MTWYSWWFRNPAHQLIWQISHSLQGFCTSQVVGLGISEPSMTSPAFYLLIRQGFSPLRMKPWSRRKPTLKDILSWVPTLRRLIASREPKRTSARLAESRRNVRQPGKDQAQTWVFVRNDESRSFWPEMKFDCPNFFWCFIEFSKFCRIGVWDFWNQTQMMVYFLGKLIQGNGCRFSSRWADWFFSKDSYVHHNWLPGCWQVPWRV